MPAQHLRTEDPASRQLGENLAAYLNDNRSAPLSAVQDYIDRGADLTALGTIEKVTPLIAAARSGLDQIVQLLLASGADADGTSGTGQTALMVSRNVACAGLLLAAGADIHKKSDDDSTALMIAARRGNGEVLQFLLAKSTAQINDRDKRGLTALMHAATPVAHYDCLNALIHHGADPERAYKGRTALEIIAYNGVEPGDADKMQALEKKVKNIRTNRDKKVTAKTLSSPTVQPIRKRGIARRPPP